MFFATGVGMTGPTPKINAFTSSKENCEGGYVGIYIYWYALEDSGAKHFDCVC